MCDQCECNYGYKSNLSGHMKKAHGKSAKNIKNEMDEGNNSTASTDESGLDGALFSQVNLVVTSEANAGETNAKFSCFMCMREFTTEPRLTNHKRKAHGLETGEQKAQIPCDDCNKTFTSRTGRRLHRMKYHSLESEETKSNDSSSKGLTEPSSKGLWELSGKEFSCTYNCGKSFAYANNRNTHEIKSHGRVPKRKGKSAAPKKSNPAFQIEFEDSNISALIEGKKKKQALPANSCFQFSSQEEEEEVFDAMEYVLEEEEVKVASNNDSMEDTIEEQVEGLEALVKQAEAVV
jgi:hypothetical protein